MISVVSGTQNGRSMGKSGQAISWGLGLDFPRFSTSCGINILAFEPFAREGQSLVLMVDDPTIAKSVMDAQKM